MTDNTLRSRLASSGFALSSKGKGRDRRFYVYTEKGGRLIGTFKEGFCNTKELRDLVAKISSRSPLCWGGENRRERTPL